MPRKNDDHLRVLIFTDTHLGFKDGDEILKEDSINTFEEILQIAKNNEVDCMLHAGDLFDENRPSRSTFYKTMNLLEKYVTGRSRNFVVRPGSCLMLTRYSYIQ